MREQGKQRTETEQPLATDRVRTATDTSCWRLHDVVKHCIHASQQITSS